MANSPSLLFCQWKPLGVTRGNFIILHAILIYVLLPDVWNNLVLIEKLPVTTNNEQRVVDYWCTLRRILYLWGTVWHIGRRIAKLQVMLICNLPADVPKFILYVALTSHVNSGKCCSKFFVHSVNKLHSINKIEKICDQLNGAAGMLPRCSSEALSC